MKQGYVMRQDSIAMLLALIVMFDQVLCCGETLDCRVHSIS
jgi:hypothetical protein